MEFAQIPTESNQVKVKVLLENGREYQLFLSRHSPLLSDLFKTLSTKKENRQGQDFQLFQIPLEEGNATLYFPSDRLVGMIVEPSIKIAPQSIEISNSSVSTQSDPLRSEYMQISNFLTQTECQKLLDYVQKQESAFVTTSTSTNGEYIEDYRRSMVLYSFPEFAELITKRIQAIMPDIFRKLKIAPFAIAKIESQLTLHNDGNFYKVHNDNGSIDTADRELTYVYYFYREPKAFAGGELVIYDSKIENNFYVKGESYKIVEPQYNSMVFFLSRYLHEVLPISCPTRAFADSRFTINGWISKQVN